MVDEYFSDYCNILVDLPGHGESALRHTSNHEELLNDLCKQMRSAGFDRFIPIGYSMGGRIALHLQRVCSFEVAGIVGLSAAPGLKTRDERDKRQKSDTELMDKLKQWGFETFLNEWYALPLFQSIAKNPQIIKSLLYARSQNDPDQLRFALDLFGNGAMNSLWNELARIECPVLLISGELDQKYCDINQQMCDSLPRGEHHIMENTDHAFHLEKPLQTAHLIRHFLGQVIKGE